jgi:dTDP-4-amino-4,6-dideoxygalactose transaminase
VKVGIEQLRKTGNDTSLLKTGCRAVGRVGHRAHSPWPKPLHRQPALADRCSGLDLPQVEDVCRRCLSLLIHPELG